MLVANWCTGLHYWHDLVIKESWIRPLLPPDRKRQIQPRQDSNEKRKKIEARPYTRNPNPCRWHLYERWMLQRKQDRLFMTYLKSHFETSSAFKEHGKKISNLIKRTVLMCFLVTHQIKQKDDERIVTRNYYWISRKTVTSGFIWWMPNDWLWIIIVRVSGSKPARECLYPISKLSLIDSCKKVI